MATIAGDAPYQERSLFVRKATGLVRGWSVHDAFIYATFSINLITLGLYIFADGPFIPKGSLLVAIILSGAYLCFQTIVYAALIAVMPRAGGDYVWVSRVIGRGCSDADEGHLRSCRLAGRPRVRIDDLARPDDRVLQPMVELGRDALRRSARRL